MSETKVKKASKMKIAVISLACALVLAVGGMIGIYAATQQTVGSTFTVSYSVGDNVAIAVGANIHGPYSTDSEKGYDWFSQSGTLEKNENGLFVINATEQNDYGLQLSLSDINMEMQSWGGIGVVMFAFYFENLGEESILATVTNNCDIKNMNVGYYLDTITVPEDAIDQDIASTNYVPGSNDQETGFDENNECSFLISEGQIWCFVAVVTVVDENKSAHFKSTAENGLEFSFTNA